MEDGHFKRSFLPACPEPPAIHFRVRLTVASFSVMKSSLTGSPSAATTSVGAAWMNSVQGQTRSLNSRCRCPIIRQSMARQAAGSRISVINQEPMIFMGRFLNTTKTQFLTRPGCWQTRLALLRIMRKRTTSVALLVARSKRITPSSFSTSRGIVSEAFSSLGP